MPLNALALISVVAFILSLIYIGSSTAYNAIVSLTAIGLNISYVIPISFFLLRKVRGPPLAYGPFKLGRWGIPVNLASLAYLIFIITWMPFPQVLPVDRETMNYAGPVLIVIILAAFTDWQFSGHKRFQVPVPRNLPDF
jgi:choline transport protein